VITDIDAKQLWEDLKAFATKDEKNIMLLSMIVCAIGVCCSVMCMMCCCRSKASDHQDVDEEMAGRPSDLNAMVDYQPRVGDQDRAPRRQASPVKPNFDYEGEKEKMLSDIKKLLKNELFD